MKPKFTRYFLAAAVTSVLALSSSAFAANFYWDDGTVVVNGASGGGSGAWTVGAAGWEDGTAAQTWANGNDAILGGTAGTLTLGSAISANTVSVNTTSYSFAMAGNTLTTGALNYGGAAGGALTFTGNSGTTSAQNTVTLNGAGTGWASGTSVNLNGAGNPAVGSTQNGALLKLVFGNASALGSAELKVKHAMIQAGSPGMTITNAITNAGASLYFGGENDFTVSGLIKNDTTADRTVGVWTGATTSRTITLTNMDTNGRNFNFEARGSVTNPNPGGGFIVNGAIFGTGGISTVGATQFVGNTVTLNGTNTYTGVTNHFSGTIAVGAAGSITATSGVRVDTNAIVNNAGSVTSTGSAAVDDSGGTVSLALRGSGLTGGTFNNSGTASFATAGLNGNTNLTGGSMTVSGQFNVGQAAGNYGVINQSAGITTLSTAVADGIRIGHWTTSANTSAYNLSGGTLNVPNTTYNNGWDGNASLNISGGTANLKGLANGAPGHGGNADSVNLNGGRLNIGSSGITSNGAGVKVFNLGAATVGASADWTGSAAMTLTDTVTGTTFNTLDSVDNTTARAITISGILSGAGNLVKTGAGTLSLGGVNTFTGATNVNNGTLLVSGNISTSILTTVASGATIAAGGFVSPGNSPGILNTGDLTMAGTYNAELTGLAPGTGYDQINVTGSTTLSGMLNLTASFTPTNGDLFFILMNDGTDPVGGTFSGLANGSSIFAGAQQYQISYFANAEGTPSFTGGNDVALMAIPEPGVTLLGGLGVLLLLRRRR